MADRVNFRHSAATAVLVSLLLGIGDATAQLRGLGGGGGIGGSVPGVGGGIGVPGSGLGGGLGGLPSVPGTGVPNPSVNTDLTPVEGLYGSAGSTLDRNVVDPLQRPVTGALPNPLNPRTPAPGLLNRPAVTRVPPATERRYVPNEVLLGLPSNLSAQELDALARRHGLTRIESQRIGLTGTTLHRWQIIDQRSVSDVIRAIEADRGIGLAQPNYQFTLQQDRPAMPLSTDQYVLAKLRIADAHKFAAGAGISIAVIDGGIDSTHPELSGAVAQAFDAIEEAEPPSLHGTGMAGAIAAHARLTGVAPGARILAVRAFSTSGKGNQGTSLSLLRGIDWAVAHGAKVINMSFAGPRDPELASSLAAAAKKGIVLIAAAGNAGPKSPPLYPAADPNVIAVTGTDADDHLYVNANRGRYVAIAAPGVDVLVPAPRGTYQFATGTSVATALVSGIAALMLEIDPRLTPAKLRKILSDTAKDLGPKGRDDQFGAGLADAHRAVQSVAGAAAASTRPTVSSVR